MIIAKIGFCFDEAELDHIDTILSPNIGSRNPVVGRFIRYVPVGVVKVIEIDEIDLIVFIKYLLRLSVPQR